MAMQLLNITTPGSAPAEGQIIKIVGGVPAWSDPMSIEYTRAGETVSTTPVSLTAGGTVIQARTGVVGNRTLRLNATAMAAGDQYLVSVYEKGAPGGAQQKTQLGVLSGAQTGLSWFGPFALGTGWDFALEKLAGTDRAFDAVVFVGAS